MQSLEDLDSYFDMGFSFNLEAHPVEVYVMKYINGVLGAPQRVSLGPDGNYYIPGSKVGYTFPAVFAGLNFVKGCFVPGTAQTTAPNIPIVG